MRLPRLRIHVLLVSLIVLLSVNPAWPTEKPDEEIAESSNVQFTLDEIVISANKIEEPVRDVPKHVTVITGEEIRGSTGKNVIDLLGKEAGINVRSNSGTDKHAVIDLRGMGDTAASNVIVMVDDIRLNAPDQSGPSISSIPVEQIERIEIVRGAGSVIYGNGAVGGVINIITKPAGEERNGSVYSSYGSYGTVDTRASFDEVLRDVGLSLNAGYFDSDGYRDNGFLGKKDISSKARYPFSESLTFNLSGTYYEDEYGLPGTVSREDIDSESMRVMTDQPDDSGESSEFRGRGGVEVDLERWGALSLNRAYRFREDNYVIGYSPLIARSDQEDEIDEDTRIFDFNYIKDYDLFGLPHMFQFGTDNSKTEYVREEMPDGPRKNSETDETGVFINNQWSLTGRLLLTAGARYDEYDGRFRTDERKDFDGEKLWVNGDTTRKGWENEAYALGTTYSVAEDTTIFASYSTSFRIPNVDEFAESEEGLHPQKGDHAEIGGRKRFGDITDVTLSLFDIRIEDEIYYSDINRNFDDKTIRQGVEGDLKIYPSDYVKLWGNYAYTKARFEGKDTTVPLVPEHRGSAGVQWEPISFLQIDFSGTYTGSRYDGNDIENDRYAKLDDYVVFDTKASYKYRSMTVFFGVNNIFNELYSTSGYSEQYYPMPERNIFGGFRWTFL